MWGYACPRILNADEPDQESKVHIWSSLLNDVENLSSRKYPAGYCYSGNGYPRKCHSCCIKLSKRHERKEFVQIYQRNVIRRNCLAREDHCINCHIRQRWQSTFNLEMTIWNAINSAMVTLGTVNLEMDIQAVLKTISWEKVTGNQSWECLYIVETVHLERWPL